jgi:hypothetical protein
MEKSNRLGVDSIEVSEDDSVAAWTHWDAAQAEQALRMASGFAPLELQDGALAQMNQALDVISARHSRVAKAIRTYWGHTECHDYLEGLLLSATDPQAHQRNGFSREVATCLLLLMGIHEKVFGPRKKPGSDSVHYWL